MSTDAATSIDTVLTTLAAEGHSPADVQAAYDSLADAGFYGDSYYDDATETQYLGADDIDTLRHQLTHA